MGFKRRVRWPGPERAWVYFPSHVCPADRPQLRSLPCNCQDGDLAKQAKQGSVGREASGWPSYGHLAKSAAPKEAGVEPDREMSRLCREALPSSPCK